MITNKIFHNVNGHIFAPNGDFNENFTRYPTLDCLESAFFTPRRVESELGTNLRPVGGGVVGHTFPTRDLLARRLVLVSDKYIDNFESERSRRIAVVGFAKIIFIHLTRSYKFCNITYIEV